MVRAELSEAFLYFDAGVADPERFPDSPIEQDAYLGLDRASSRSTKQGFLKSVISGLDWYRAGSSVTPFNFCSDPGASFDVQEPAKSFGSAISAGGNVVLPSKGSVKLPQASTLERTASRKRSLDSVSDEGDELWAEDCWSPRQRVE